MGDRIIVKFSAVLRLLGYFGRLPIRRRDRMISDYFILSHQVRFALNVVWSVKHFTIKLYSTLFFFLYLVGCCFFVVVVVVVAVVLVFFFLGGGGGWVVIERKKP